MTDIAALESYAGVLSESAQRAGAASQILHNYIHSDDQADVLTESGLVPSLAKQAKIAEVNSNISIRRSEITADESFAYKKKIIPFPSRHPRYAESVARYGSIYPQAFCIDITADELLFVSASGAITVFVWSTRAYKKTYNTAPSFVSESAVIKYVAGTRFLYLRGNGTLLVFDITTTTQWQDLAPSQTIAVNAQRNFAEYAGEWVIALDNVNPIGFFRSRGYFGIYNATFGRIGNVYLSPLQCGIQEGTPHEGAISKMQGMSFDGKTIYLGMGGYWNSASTNKAYGAYGVRTFTRDGKVTGDYLLDPDKFISKLTSLGYHPDHCENEGVQFVQETNTLYTLMVGMQDSSDPMLATSEGLYVIQEFCTDSDAIDFSSCATSISTIDEIHRDGGVLFPRSGSTGLVNPLTGATFTSWAGIVDYMKSVDMSTFMYYSSNVAITDLNGVALPSGLLVTIRNTNNSTFLVSATNLDTGRIFRLVGTIQTEGQNRPTLQLLPATDNNLTLGAPSLRWSVVYAGTGTINTSDERMKQQIRNISDNILDAWAGVDYQQYKFNDAVELKGNDAARWHFGVVAQRVKEVFESFGLDPFANGVLCYDTWEEEAEVIESLEDETDEFGVITREAGSAVVKPHLPAGDRYGIRYEEALVLEAALMRRTVERLQAAVASLAP